MDAGLAGGWLDAKRPESSVFRRFASMFGAVEIFLVASRRYDFSSPNIVGQSMTRASIAATRPRKHERVV
ncbi:hypothetical protein [Burkholderia cepacia]|uniref:hypothetical protein n=1 Tax=Burkholderia cepacia TaxID=292 RepID=UPI0012971FAF|nr:hypothetical protein [Burkholderia cepacia]